MGPSIEWPEVVTEGADLEECRAMFRDAIHEMVLAYRELGREIPVGNALLEQLPVEMDLVRPNRTASCASERGQRQKKRPQRR